MVVTVSKRFYSTRTGSTEPNMRQEFNNTLDGIFPEVPKAQSAILRKMRRDSSDQLIECPCVDDLTHEPDLDTFCPVCHGEGYLWDESWIDVYKVILRSDKGLSTKETLISPGLMNISLVSIYLKSSVDITDKDKVVEMILDTSGTPVRPYRRKFIYRIGTIVDFRSDNGKLEYTRLDCYAEKRKFLNGLES
jgi:hypothetical protein